MAKILYAFANGLSRRKFFGEDSLTDETLREELFPEMAHDAYETLRERFEAALTAAASNDWDTTALDAHLNSIGSEQAETDALVKLWKAQRARVHAEMVSKSRFGASLDDAAWRIDVKTRSRHISQLNENTAVVQLSIRNRNSDDATAVRFEADEDQLRKFVDDMDAVEARLAEAASAKTGASRRVKQ